MGEGRERRNRQREREKKSNIHLCILHDTKIKPQISKI